MAVQVPKLQRIQPSAALPANERINLKVDSQASNILNQTQGLANLGKEAVDLSYDIEDSKIQQLSLSAEQEYSSWNTQQLQKLKSYEGDPTDAYVEYDKQAQQKRDEILNARPDLNERVRSHLTANLDKTVGSQNMTAMKQRGAQQETYDNNNFQAGIKLKKDGLSTAASYIRKDDPGSFMPMDDGINDIKTTIAQRGLIKGTVSRLPDDAKTWSHMYKDPEGKLVKVQMSDIAKQATAKEVAEGVGASINSMIAAGYTEEAQAAYDRYKPYIDTKYKTTLENKFNTTAIKATAFNEIGRIESMPEGQRLAEVEKITNPQVRSEALKILDTNANRREAIKDRREKANYEVLGSKVLEKMNSDNPYYGISDLENDPTFKATYDRLDVKGKKAIMEMVKAPKDTNPESEVKVQDLLLGSDPSMDINNVSPAQFQKMTVGLNKSDKSKYTNMYNRLKQETAGEERTKNKRAEKFLQDQLLADKYISKNDYGKYTGKSEIKLIQARNELLDHLSTAPKNMSDTDLLKYVQKYSADKIKEQVFVPPQRKVFTETASQTIPTNNSIVPPTKSKALVNPEDGLPQPQKLQLRQKYKKEFGRWPVLDSSDYLNYVKKNS